MSIIPAFTHTTQYHNSTTSLIKFHGDLIPQDILEVIASYLSPEELIRSSRTCRAIRKIVTSTFEGQYANESIHRISISLRTWFRNRKTTLLTRFQTFSSDLLVSRLSQELANTRLSFHLVEKDIDSHDEVERHKYVDIGEISEQHTTPSQEEGITRHGEGVVSYTMLVKAEMVHMSFIANVLTASTPVVEFAVPVASTIATAFLATSIGFQLAKRKLQEPDGDLHSYNQEDFEKMNQKILHFFDSLLENFQSSAHHEIKKSIKNIKVWKISIPTHFLHNQLSYNELLLQSGVKKFLYDMQHGANLSEGDSVVAEPSS